MYVACCPRLGIVCVEISLYLTGHSHHKHIQTYMSTPHQHDQPPTFPYLFFVSSHVQLLMSVYRCLCFVHFFLSATQVAHVYHIWSSDTTYTHTYTPIPHPHRQPINLPHVFSFKFPVLLPLCLFVLAHLLLTFFSCATHTMTTLATSAIYIILQ